MKKLLLLLLLPVAGVMNAQIVNIPDAALHAQLITSSTESPVTQDSNGNYFVLDANGDGIIQQSEANLVHGLVIGNSSVTSIDGIQNFPNLDFVVCNFWSAVSYDFNLIPNLRYLQCQGDVSNIIINGAQNLEELHLNYATSTTINLENLPSLKVLFLYDGAYENLVFHDLPLLNNIRIESQPLTEITLYNLPSLKILRVPDNGLTTLNLTDVPTLEWVDGSNNPLASVNLSGLTQLEDAGFSWTSLEEIDFSECPSLSSVALNYNPNLNYINFKNGTSPADAFYMIGGTTSVNYICADEDDIEVLSQSFGITGTQVEINTYCSFTPGGDYNTITGNVYLECGASVPLIGFVSLNISNAAGTGTAYTNTGNYSFYTPGGDFVLSPQMSGDLFTVSPATASVNFADNNNNTATQDFCLTANGVHPDVEIIIVPIVPARPGFDATYKIIYTNKGNQTLSGDVVFAYDGTVLDYVSASPVESASATGSLTWSYSNLAPFESREVTITLNVNSPMETPAVNIDDALDFSVTVTPTANDETPWDNTFGLKQIVVGSYDPNDITCIEGNIVHPERIGEYLHYNINFENTGTYPASFVVVKDVIDQTQFDVSTLQLINASHDVEARVTGNKVEFYFDDINLAANGGKGNVVFKIKSLGTLQVNDDVTQQAEIFFDYNWPIETNDATTVFSVLSNPEFDKDAAIKVYPNPAGNTVTISAQSELRHVELYDVQGRLLQSVPANGTQASLDLSGRAGGVYFVKAITEKGAGVERVMKM